MRVKDVLVKGYFFFIAIFCRECYDEGMKKEKWAEKLTLILCSAAAAFAFFVYAPYSIYFPNAEEFTFTFYDFWWIPLLCFATSWAMLLIPGILFRKVRCAWCGFLFGITLCMLLQGSLLYQDYGAFNGLPYDWQSNLRQILPDAAVWLLVTGICIFCLMRWEKVTAKLFTAGSAVLLAFLILTCGLLIASSKREYLLQGETFVSDRDLLTVSETQNVLVIVLDMFDSSYMETILESDEETAENFRDFTWYANTTGCFGSTNYSLGSFLSGGLMLNQQPSYRETLNANYENNLLFPALLENNWQTGIYTEGKFIPHKLAENADNCLKGEKAAIQDIPAFLSALYRMCACRFAPDAFRPFVWLSGNEFDGLYRLTDSEFEAFTVSNSAFYERLLQENITVTEQPCFRFIHLFGAHYPYLTDEYLNPISPSYSDANAVGAAKGALRIVQRYLELLKESEAYDNSLIILMGDHGYSIDGGLTNPLLMIKAAGNRGEFSVSYSPVSLADLQKTILTALDIPAETAEGENILAADNTRESDRMYYQMFDTAQNGQSRLVEYTVAPEGNERKYYQLTDREMLPDGEIRQHSEHCACCQQNGLAPLDLPNDASVIH